MGAPSVTGQRVKGRGAPAGSPLLPARLLCCFPSSQMSAPGAARRERREDSPAPRPMVPVPSKKPPSQPALGSRNGTDQTRGPEAGASPSGGLRAPVGAQTQHPRAPPMPAPHHLARGLILAPLPRPSAGQALRQTHLASSWGLPK